jgi:DNA-binding NarL/FixJ family response regulator
LFLSHQGVKAHLTNLFRKFGVKNRAQLILTVIDEVSPVGSLSGMVYEGLR